VLVKVKVAEVVVSDTFCVLSSFVSVVKVEIRRWICPRLSLGIVRGRNVVIVVTGRRWKLRARSREVSVHNVLVDRSGNVGCTFVVQVVVVIRGVREDDWVKHVKRVVREIVVILCSERRQSENVVNCDVFVCEW
jgi:hypothetical protein